LAGGLTRSFEELRPSFLHGAVDAVIRREPAVHDPTQLWSDKPLDVIANRSQPYSYPLEDIAHSGIGDLPFAQTI